MKKVKQTFQDRIWKRFKAAGLPEWRLKELTSIVIEEYVATIEEKDEVDYELTWKHVVIIVAAAILLILLMVWLS